MSDLRKPFYDYAIRKVHADNAWKFAEWALEFMSDSTPERAFAAYHDVFRRELVGWW